MISIQDLTDEQLKELQNDKFICGIAEMQSIRFAIENEIKSIPF